MVLYNEMTTCSHQHSTMLQICIHESLLVNHRHHPRGIGDDGVDLDSSQATGQQVPARDRIHRRLVLL
jgi:hypothetical protein